MRGAWNLTVLLKIVEVTTPGEISCPTVEGEVFVNTTELEQYVKTSVGQIDG